MVHVHGVVVEQFTARTAGVALEDLIAVAVDVGKHSAWAVGCDFTGGVVVPAFEGDHPGGRPCLAMPPGAEMPV